MPTTLYYSNVSLNAQPVLLLIKYLKLSDIELRELDLRKGEQFAPEFVRKNPQHTVPFLDDNGFYLSESRAILYYLVDSRAPESNLIGRFPKRRAVVQQRLFFILGTVEPAVGQAFFPIMRREATTVPEAAVEKIRAALDLVETYLGQSRYAAGDDVTIADFSYLARVSMLLAIWPQIRENYRNIAAWYKRCSTLPGFSEMEATFANMTAMLQSAVTEPIPAMF